MLSVILRVSPDVDSLALEAASIIASEARTAIAGRGRFVIAVSGGHTPWKMLRIFAAQDVDWEAVHVFQVDERVAPEGDPDRNLTHLQECLADASIAESNIHAMLVNAEDLSWSMARYEMTLREIAGNPPLLDLVHLGIGVDGHTASLVPGDPVLNVTDQNVALTENYQGRTRMTLTLPILNRSRKILWLVTGAEKADVLRRLCDGDSSMPAGRLKRDQAIVLADNAAAARLGCKVGFATGIHNCYS